MLLPNSNVYSSMHAEKPSDTCLCFEAKLSYTVCIGLNLAWKSPLYTEGCLYSTSTQRTALLLCEMNQVREQI